MSKLTAQDYRNAIMIMEDYSNNSKFFGLESYCLSKIAELEKPARRQYRCIKNMKEGAFVGEIWNEEDHWYLIHPFDLPFHFEEIKPEPVKEPITWRKVVTMLAIFGHRLPEGSSRTEHFDLIKQIKEGHGA